VAQNNFANNPDKNLTAVNSGLQDEHAVSVAKEGGR